MQKLPFTTLEYSYINYHNFQELNRNSKFQSVVRLYNKHELSLAYNGQNKYYEKVKQQYEYAKENIESLKKATDGSVNGRNNTM